MGCVKKRCLDLPRQTHWTVSSKNRQLLAILSFQDQRSCKNLQLPCCSLLLVPCLYLPGLCWLFLDRGTHDGRLLYLWTFFWSQCTKWTSFAIVLRTFANSFVSRSPKFRGIQEYARVSRDASVPVSRDTYRGNRDLLCTTWEQFSFGPSSGCVFRGEFVVPVFFLWWCVEYRLSSCLPSENRRQRLERTEGKNRMPYLLSKKTLGARSRNAQCPHPVCLQKKPRRIQLVWRQPKKVTTCFVLNGYWDTSEIGWSKRTSPDGVNRSDAFDTDGFNRFHSCRYQNGEYFRRSRRGQWRRAMVKRDRLQVGLEHKIQRWNVPWYAVVLRDYPKKVVSSIKVESVPGNMREFLSWTQNHWRIDATTSTWQRKAGEPTLVVPCPSGCKEFSHTGSKEHFVRSACKIRGTVRKERRTPQLHVLNDTRTTGRSNYTRER